MVLEIKLGYKFMFRILTSISKFIASLAANEFSYLYTQRSLHDIVRDGFTTKIENIPSDNIFSYLKRMGM